MNHQQRGFSLFELAISLAVLAILAGGVLKGRELLNSARVQATLTDIANLETALSAFQARYSALPGDFIAASAAGLGNAAGDGDGLIAGIESCAVFEHLQLSGFIQGSFTRPRPQGSVFSSRRSERWRSHSSSPSMRVAARSNRKPIAITTTNTSAKLATR